MYNLPHHKSSHLNLRNVFTDLKEGADTETDSEDGVVVVVGHPGEVLEDGDVMDDGEMVAMEGLEGIYEDEEEVVEEGDGDLVGMGMVVGKGKLPKGLFVDDDDDDEDDDEKDVERKDSIRVGGGLVGEEYVKEHGEWAEDIYDQTATSQKRWSISKRTASPTAMYAPIGRVSMTRRNSSNYQYEGPSAPSSSSASNVYSYAYSSSLPSSSPVAFLNSKSSQPLLKGNGSTSSFSSSSFSMTGPSASAAPSNSMMLSTSVPSSNFLGSGVGMTGRSMFGRKSSLPISFHPSQQLSTHHHHHQPHHHHLQNMTARSSSTTPTPRRPSGTMTPTIPLPIHHLDHLKHRRHEDFPADHDDDADVGDEWRQDDSEEDMEDMMERYGWSGVGAGFRRRVLLGEDGDYSEEYSEDYGDKDYGNEEEEEKEEERGMVVEVEAGEDKWGSDGGSGGYAEDDENDENDDGVVPRKVEM
jgi:hypothetical protein